MKESRVGVYLRFEDDHAALQAQLTPPLNNLPNILSVDPWQGLTQTETFLA